MDQLSMFSSLEAPARDSALPGDVSAWMTRAATWRSTPLELCATLLRPGSSLRTSLVCFPLGVALRKVRQEWKMDSKTGEPGCVNSSSQVTSPSSFNGFRTSGILAPGQCWMLNTSAWRSGASACSLSDILETGVIPPQYFLSPKACAGILRRAAKRGKELLAALKMALESVAHSRTPARDGGTKVTVPNASELLMGGGSLEANVVTGTINARTKGGGGLGTDFDLGGGFNRGRVDGER